MVSSQAILDSEPENQTLETLTRAVSQSKIESMVGQGAAIQSNMNSGVDYAQIAQYGEMSKQQGTQQSIEKQGGVGGAVANDITNAQEKAITSQQHAQNMRASCGKDLEDSAALYNNIDKENAKIWHKTYQRKRKKRKI